MKGVEFKDQTHVLGKPKDMSDEECSSLPIKRTKNAGHDVMESVWELSDEDIKTITLSRRIRLGVLGQVHPPVYIIPEQVTN